MEVNWWTAIALVEASVIIVQAIRAVSVAIVRMKEKSEQTEWKRRYEWMVENRDAVIGERAELRTQVMKAREALGVKDEEHFFVGG